MAAGTFQFRLRHIFALTAIIALAVALSKWGNDTVLSIEREAARYHYDEGHITREGARDWVGDVVDQWPEKGGEGGK
jgi:hypothetical protein